MSYVGKLDQVEFVRGDYFTESFAFYEDEEETTPIDLTVYDEIYMDIRVEPKESSKRILRLSLGNGISITGDDNEILMIEIESDNSELFSSSFYQFNNSTGTLAQRTVSGIYYRDIRFIINDVVFTMLSGKIKIISNITNT